MLAPHVGPICGRGEIFQGEGRERGNDLPAQIPNSRADENKINIVPISFDFVACQELLDSFAPSPSYEQECGLWCYHVSLTSNKENFTSIPCRFLYCRSSLKSLPLMCPM